MNEPEHPHFVLSDGQYCHVLKEGLIVSKKKAPQQLPEQKDTPDYTSLGLLGAGIIILTFLSGMCAVTGMYLVVVLLGALDIFAIMVFIRMIGFSQTEFIPRNDIQAVNYVKRNFGFDWFIIHYTGKDGKHHKRRLMLYDSKEAITQAVNVMQAEGFLSNAQ